MRLGMAIYSNDPETVWNGFRFDNYALNEGETVQIFLIGKGVESESIDTGAFNVAEQMRSFVEGGGAIAACETYLKIHHLRGSELCPISTLGDLLVIVKKATRSLPSRLTLM